MAKNRIKNEGSFTRTEREIANHNFSDVSFCTTQLDLTSATGTTFTNIAGMVTDNLIPGETYKFTAKISQVCTANNGSKFAFKQGAASMLASIEYVARQYTASAPATSRGTTTTDQTAMADNAASVVIYTEIHGAFTLNNTQALIDAKNLGLLTLQLQAAQHTSHADTLSIFKKSLLQVEHNAVG